MSWTDDLAASVRAALESGEPRQIIVATSAQAELGKRAAERLARSLGGDPASITFEVRSHSSESPIL